MELILLALSEPFRNMSSFGGGSPGPFLFSFCGWVALPLVRRTRALG